LLGDGIGETLHGAFHVERVLSASCVGSGARKIGYRRGDPNVPGWVYSRFVCQVSTRWRGDRGEFWQYRLSIRLYADHTLEFATH
jgi:hypothetical protein